MTGMAKFSPHPVSNRRNFRHLRQDIMYDLTRRIMMFVESSFSARLVAWEAFFWRSRGTSSTCRSAPVWCRMARPGNTKLSIRDDRWSQIPSLTAARDVLYANATRM
jgi:hypothetical protein